MSDFTLYLAGNFQDAEGWKVRTVDN